MAADSSVHSSKQVLEAVWTKFEPITSPTSRLRLEKQPTSPFWHDFCYFYGNFERLMGGIIGNGCSQHLTQTRTSVRSSLDQVWTNNEPYKSSYVQKTAKIAIFWPQKKKCIHFADQK